MISLMMIHLIKGFNTQPPEGGCIIPTGAVLIVDVSTLSRPKAAGSVLGGSVPDMRVSTLSRPKAAAFKYYKSSSQHQFQHSAARRRLVLIRYVRRYSKQFQHSAARRRLNWASSVTASFNCFNTQPPEGGCEHGMVALFGIGRFNTQPPEGGWLRKPSVYYPFYVFQHSAARRRLPFPTHHWPFPIRVSTLSRPKAAVPTPVLVMPKPLVSTLSRPKAAADSANHCDRCVCFNTQPPEGGCYLIKRIIT